MFELTQNTFASRDSRGNIRHIEHIREPFLMPSLQEPTPEQLADAYLSEVAPIYQIETGLLAALSSSVPGEPIPVESQIHRSQVKDIAGSFVVDYTQSFAGLPVWRADFAVHIASNPMRVTSSTSTLHNAITLGNNPNEVAEQYERILTPETISQFLGIQGDLGVSRINGMNLVIYQYNPEQRIEPGLEESEGNATSFEHGPSMPELPPVPDAFQSGVHYAVVEALSVLIVLKA